MSTNDDTLDNVFHGHALLAFVEIAQKQGNWPDSEEVKKLAYKNFEERKNAG
jgi:hypothetical protein